MSTEKLRSLLAQSDELVSAMNHLVTSTMDTDVRMEYVEFEDFYYRYMSIRKDIARELINPPSVGS